MLAPTCFGSSLPSSGSFWIRLSYLKIRIDMVVTLPTLCYRILQFACLPPWTHALYHTCFTIFLLVVHPVVLFVILTLVRPDAITSFNLFNSTQGTLHTDSYLLHILDKTLYRSVFSHNSDRSRSSLKMADYCRNM
jgi:hypothetical protein